MYRENLRNWQRLLRIGCGCLFIVWAAAGGAGWGYFVGLFFLTTGAWGVTLSVSRKRRARL